MGLLTTLGTGDSESETEKTYNSYMEVPVPFGQWTVLMMCVFLKSINSMFITKSNQGKKSLKEEEGFKRPDSEAKTTVDHDADYYETTISQTLTKKFPLIAKIFIRLNVFFSEMMILTILIVQSMVLAF